MKKKLTLALFAISVLLVFTATAAELKQAKVTKVVDGDTIDVRYDDGSSVTVRYIGVDTPETHGGVEHFGKEATAYNENLVGNKTVWLEIGEEAEDKYDRLLAYVYLDPAQKSMVNAILVAQGYAEVMTIPPNDKHADLFEELASDAENDSRGMWAEDEEDGKNTSANESVASCQTALNEAVQEDFEEVYGIGEGIASRLVESQPYEGCDSVDCLRDRLKKVSYVGETRSEDVLKHFCPELLE